jgi:hypothetical protein
MTDKINELMALADAYANDYAASCMGGSTGDENRKALRTALEAALKHKDEKIAELERLCDSTYVAQGADAYNLACDEMERWQEARAAAGKEVGTTGSLCDGMAWLYGRLDALEAALKECRNATLEEAAQSADEWGDSEVDPSQVSKEIRSLKT